MRQQRHGSLYIWGGHIWFGMYLLKYVLLPFVWQYPEVRSAFFVLWSIPAGNIAAILYSKSPEVRNKFVGVPFVGKIFTEIGSRKGLSKRTKIFSSAGILINASIACIFAPWWGLQVLWVIYACFCIWKIAGQKQWEER